MIGYLDDVVIPLVLKLPKTSGRLKLLRVRKINQCLSV